MGQLRDCTRFKVYNHVLPDPGGTGTGIEVWAYRKVDCVPRTSRLAAGLQKLGKLPNKYNDDALEALFFHILPEPVPGPR